MKSTVIVDKKVSEITSIVCDKCKEEYSVNELMEIQEFLHISFTSGYDSVFGDMTQVECDICQHCLKGLIGDICRCEEIIF
jgi:hypothetical protein